MEIEGAAALVTGGASGLGAATARALRDAGASVVILDLPAAADQVPEGDGIALVAGDITDPAAVAEAVAAATERGPLRVLVNCAGIGRSARTVGREGPHELDLFRQVIDVNLVGTFNVIRLAAATMQLAEPIAGERGVIVNTASVAAFDGQIGQAAYAASKAAIVGMTLPIARDLSRLLIRCVTIAPGTFDTPLLASLSPEVRASLESAVPHPSRLGEPAEFASLVTHIVSNPMLNGETIRLDGAIRMAPR
ncbi:MAG TPA: SDR family NAD(P)-dependent oxidoreductase [Solirubrobacteraceae bacterium]|nr:SDR family NAD(P)-dependent oxidoreductase [Solirubrobacteraceae bacterium]